MLIRYRAGLALTSLLFLIAATPHKPAHANDTAPRQSIQDIYSKRALRRARTILQLQLLQMRAQRLEGVANAVRRTLEASAIRPPAPYKERPRIDLP